MSAPASISVALCTHNGARFLAEQVSSILAQSRLPREIVLSDDASTDESVAIVSKLVGEFNAVSSHKVTLVTLANPTPLGVTKNFEQAIAECTSELVALCDQDDRWHPEKLAVMAAEFDARLDLTLLHSDLTLVDADGAPLGSTLFSLYGVGRVELDSLHSGRAVDVFLRRNLVTGAATLFRRIPLEISRPFPPSWVHDEWLGMVAAVRGRVDTLEEPLVDYRQHGVNQIGARKLDFWHYLASLRVPRSARNDRLFARAEAMTEHVVFGSGADDVAGLRSIAQGKLAHEIARRSYPASRFRRWGPIIREIKTGGYRLYGLGAQDIIRDFLQPA
jgi:glycosyltransferase involved in cell wall biosynthesis